MNYQKELKIVKSAVIKAGEALEKEFKNWQRGKATYKEHDEIVTWCDKKSEKTILDILNKNFPSYAVLSEESGRNNKVSDYVWVIDPMDGTSNFTIHNPLFTVSVALLYQNEIVLGVTYMPILNEMYHATKGQGAYRNNKKIQVSQISLLKKSFITYCHGQTLETHRQAYKVYEHFHEAARDCRHFGSTTLELAMVAAGNTEALIVAKPKLWDVAAGVILVEEAGGKVTDFSGNKWQTNSSNLLASNQNMHSKLKKQLKKLDT